MSPELAIESLLDVVRAAIERGDWRVDGACDPDIAIERCEQFLHESGTAWNEVCGETGLAPRQLAEQRKELMRALQGMLDNACAASDVLADGSCRIDCTQDEWDDHVRACGVARAALAKAEGRS